MKKAAPVLALFSLAVCLTAPVAFFQGSLGEDAMKTIFSIASVGWFTSASLWSARRRGTPRR
ncbi:MAG: hypothetical protein ACRD1Z_13475 [Vicinamibacteria bacterium]